MVSIEDLLEKVVHLEQELGHKAKYPVMAPLAGPFDALPSLQSAAKQIAEFVGLHNFNFTIAVTKQEPNVAGRIHLSDAGKSVSVEIDPAMLIFPDATAATLCHEICHKYLHVNGIQSPIDIDNEVLTDVTSVFLGFGKVMLNGCEAEYISHEFVTNGTRTVTRTLTSGYLKRDELAFVYRLVCAMRNIHSTDYMQGLNSEAALAVRRCDSLHGYEYDLDFHRTGAAAEIAGTFNKPILEAQRTLAELNKHSIYIKNSLCAALDNFFVRGSRTLESLSRNAVVMTEGNERDPALRFLMVVKNSMQLKRVRYDASKEADVLLQHARTASLRLMQCPQYFATPNAAMFTIVVCPIDGTTLRLPANSAVIVTCPKCRYRFEYNTTMESFSVLPKSHALGVLAAHSDSDKTTKDRHPLGCWHRIRTLMKRLRRGWLQASPVKSQTPQTRSQLRTHAHPGPHQGQHAGIYVGADEGLAADRRDR